MTKSDTKPGEKPLDDGGPAFGQWQPIETCPENKTVLFYGGMAHGGSRGRMEHDVLRMNGDRWPCWWGAGWVNHITRDRATWPTHWMPLPPPPAVMLSARKATGGDGDV